VAVDDCQSDARAWTALFYAVDMGNTEAIGALLTQSAFARANPNHPDHRGNTPLHVVCKADWNNFNDQLEMVNLLLDNGADVNKCNSKGESPLMLLVSRPHTAEAVLDRLLREGRDEGQGEEQGETAVHLDVQDRKRHDTALHRCVMHNNVSAFEALTAAGANLLIQNRPPSDKKDDPPMTPLLAALGKVPSSLAVPPKSQHLRLLFCAQLRQLAFDEQLLRDGATLLLLWGICFLFSHTSSLACARRRRSRSGCWTTPSTCCRCPSFCRWCPSSRPTARRTQRSAPSFARSPRPRPSSRSACWTCAKTPKRTTSSLYVHTPSLSHWQGASARSTEASAGQPHDGNHVAVEGHDQGWSDWAV
jgi:hypothetical protein